jgi:hypothetical protein
MNIMWIVAAVMIASGAWGGTMNFFIADQQAEKPLPWWQHVVVGVGAAFMVPLFLNMISSGLIDGIRGTNTQLPDLSKLFVLAGFCLVAAVSSRAFIRTLSDRVLQEARSANKKAEEAQEQAAEARAIVAPLVEEETPDQVTADTAALENTSEPNLNADERSVLGAITRGAFTMRSMSVWVRSEKRRNLSISRKTEDNIIAEGAASSPKAGST